MNTKKSDTKSQARSNFIPEVEKLLQNFRDDHPQASMAFNYGRVVAVCEAIQTAYHRSRDSKLRVSFISLVRQPSRYHIMMDKAYAHLNTLDSKNSSGWWKVVLREVTSNIFESVPRLWSSTRNERNDAALGYQLQLNLNQRILSRAPHKQDTGETVSEEATA